MNKTVKESSSEITNSKGEMGCTVGRRGRSSVKVETDIKDLANTATKPVTKRGKSVKAVQLEDLTSQINEELKPPSRRGKNRQNLDGSLVSEADKSISLSNKPKPKGSKGIKLSNNSITNTSISLESQYPVSKRKTRAIVEEPSPSELTNSEFTKESEASNSNPTRSRRYVNKKVEVENNKKSYIDSKSNVEKQTKRISYEDSISVEKIPELQKISRRGRKAAKEPELSADLSSSVTNEENKNSPGKDVDTQNKRKSSRQSKQQNAEITTVDNNKARGRPKQGKSIVDVVDINAEILVKKGNQKARAQKENQTLQIKENAKVNAKNKRQETDDSHSSPLKKRKVEKVTAKKLKNVDSLNNEDTHMDKRKKLSKEILDISSVDDIKPVRGRKRAAKMNDLECSPVKKGKTLKNSKPKLNEKTSNVAAVESVYSAPSGRGSGNVKLLLLQQ